MQFVVDNDTGDAISGWLAPDNPTATPSFLVRAQGRELIRFPANVMREGIRDMGLHVSGQVGFHIDSALIPNLNEYVDVEVCEVETGLVIYRRFDPSTHVASKLYLFDATLMPARVLSAEIAKRFAQAYPNFEQYGLETAIALVTAPFPKSIFIGGRANLNRFSFWFAERGFVRAALLRDPYEELAERLLFLRMVARSSKGALSPLLNGVLCLLDFAESLPLDDLGALKKAFRKATADHREAMLSPMTRWLGCEPGELPRDVHVSRALDNLASLDAVGTRSQFDLFKVLLSSALGSNAVNPEKPATLPSVATLAEMLRDLRPVEDLIAEDIRLYQLASEAVATGLALKR